MLQRIYLVLGWIALIFLVPACKSKTTATDGTEAKERSAKYVMKRMERNLQDVEWMEAKGRIGFKDPDRSMKFSVTIKMRKDSLIWMNAKKLGIEGARVLVTTDSVYMINRLMKEYAVESLAFLSREYNLPGDFKAIQDLLLGNPLLLSEGKLDSKLSEDQFELSGKANGRDRTYWLDATSFLLRRMKFVEAAQKREVTMDLNDYQRLEGQPDFSFERKLEMSSAETGEVEIEIDLSSVEVNERQSFRFEIPDHYDRVSM